MTDESPPPVPSQKKDSNSALDQPVDLAKSLPLGIRLFQMIFIGIFILGLSLMLGDASGDLKLPISSLSIATTTFGGVGAIVSEVFARQAEKWIPKKGEDK